MKNLTRIFFSIFTLVLFFACEPEAIPEDPQAEIEYTFDFDEIGDTGDQKDEIYVRKGDADDDD